MVRINGGQRTGVQFDGHLSQCDDDLPTDDIRADILGSNLYDAGFFTVRGSEDCAEVQVWVSTTYSFALA
ncbi:hypothetical protein [Metallibacterium sp.]|uniref:hypothetical protein n=1 Tax=Metallibacterium sp. TaxID=2940281 RepID=UPI002630F4AD|nr:hypothetical protein [Metallibacterium sp.]